MNPEQEKLQKEFNNKQLELNALKDKISLDQVESKKKEELEKYIAENSSKLQLQNTQIEVKSGVEVKSTTEITNKRIYEKIKDTTMNTQLTNLNKTDSEIEQFAFHIDEVVRKYYDKELAGFPSSIINGMCAGTQIAMIEAMAASGSQSNEVFVAAASDLSENGIASLFGKITTMVGGLKNKVSGILGPLSGEGALPNLAKRVQNLTAFVVLHKNDMSDGAVPQLTNPVKYKELVNNPVWDTTESFDKPETLALFTLHSTEGSQPSETETQEIKKILNNPNLKIDEATITNIEKALDTTSKFLDKRSFWQQTFMGLFDKIRGPLSMFFGKGKNLLPSDILGHGLFATALGASSLDAYYLSKNIIPVTITTSNETKEMPVDEQLKEHVASELLKYNSPVTATMVMDTSKKCKVPAEYIMAFMRNDSSYGTAGLAIKTHNPGNIGNDGVHTKDRITREAGVAAVGDNLKARIDAYQIKFGKDKFPTVAELAKGVSDNGVKFFGVYMTAKKGPEMVTIIGKELEEKGISNKEMFLAAA